MSEQSEEYNASLEELREAARFFDELPGANNQLAGHLARTLSEGADQLVISLLEYSRRYQSFHLSLIVRAVHGLYGLHTHAAGKLRADIESVLRRV